MPRHVPGRLAGGPVVITGMGIVSSIGLSLDSVSESLQVGRSGITLDEERRSLGFRSALTGHVPSIDASMLGLTRKQSRSMDETAIHAYAAARSAIEDAGLGPLAVASERTGLVFGNDSCVRAAAGAIDLVRRSGETHPLGGGRIFQVMNSTVTMNLAALLGVRGCAWTVSAACASGGHAIVQGTALIASGLLDVAIVGGVQELSWESMAAFDSTQAFSTRVDDPERAVRPFDIDRDGLVPSGGAACLVLEQPDHARSRGARIHGAVRGFGFSSDGGAHLSQPDGDGAYRAMRMALRQAGVNAAEVDYVNAHATSTKVGDRAEAFAIHRLLGTRVPVSSTKSMTGHECWMAGASEVIYTALMARDAFLAPNLNFERPDDDMPEIDIIKEVRQHRVGIALSNSFGFGGTNSVLVLDFKDSRGD